MKKLLKVVAIIILLVILFFATLIIYGSISDYVPETTEMQYTNENVATMADTSEFQLMIWNIGYCALSQDMDFFYDGGKMVTPEQSVIQNNLTNVKNFLLSNDSIDFYLIQEVDKKSSRSHDINQYDTLVNSFPNYTPSFGKNYDVFFVPLPFSDPMGAVESGVMTLSKPTATSSVRYAFPGKFEWPKNLFMLDRCFLTNRYPLSNGKELLVINSHNSAFDGGKLKKVEMEYLREFVLEEFEKGNYIIVGGDWNQSPPGVRPTLENFVWDMADFSIISDDYMPTDWKWVYKNDFPTNRRVKKPYEAGVTPTTIIDFFLLSPNIQALDVETMNLDFKYSDHQPVKIKIKLK